MKNVFQRFRGKISYFIILAVMIASLTSIFIVTASQTTIQRFAWCVNFIQSFFQDNFVQPILFLMFQYYALKFYSTTFCKSKPFLRKKVFGIFDELIIDVIVNKLSFAILSFVLLISLPTNFSIENKRG